MGYSTFSARHPMCTCERPYAVFGPGPNGMVPPSAPALCRGGTIAHPVLTRDDLRALAESWGLASEAGPIEA